jgi:hypothetical protein
MKDDGKAARERRAETTAEHETDPLRIARTRRNHHPRLSSPAQPMVEKQRGDAKARSKAIGQKGSIGRRKPRSLPFG